MLYNSYYKLTLEIMFFFLILPCLGVLLSSDSYFLEEKKKEEKEYKKQLLQSLNLFLHRQIQKELCFLSDLSIKHRCSQDYRIIMKSMILLMVAQYVLYWSYI